MGNHLPGTVYFMSFIKKKCGFDSGTLKKCKWQQHYKQVTATEIKFLETSKSGIWMEFFAFCLRDSAGDGGGGGGGGVRPPLQPPTFYSTKKKISRESRCFPRRNKTKI